MSKVMAKDSSKSKKEVKSWRQSSEKAGVTKSINVEKLDNSGFLITINKYGEDAKGKYFDNTTKLYSETNPLDENMIDPLDQLFTAISRNNK